MSWLPAVLVLGGLIFVHEMGHYLAARACGVQVEEFSLGFGPKLASVRRHGTLYALRLVPVIGYVRMAGMYPAEDDGSAEGARSKEANAQGVGFASRPLRQRVLMIAAGPLVNFVVAFLLYAIVLGAVGLPVAPTLEIRAVEHGMPAAAAGIRPGDTVTAVDGAPVASWNALHRAIIHGAGASGTRALHVTVQRGGHRQTVVVRPQRTSQGPLIGIIPRMRIARLPPWQAITKGAVATAAAIYQSLAGLVVLLVSALTHRRTQAQIMGPIGIGSAIDQASQAGTAALLLLAGILSANLGLLNLLPIPALDGGRLAFLGVEWLRGGRPVDPAKEGMVHFIGLAVLMALILLVSVHDIAHLG